MGIDWIEPEGPIVFPAIRHTDGKEYAGWACIEIVPTNPEESKVTVKVWDIHVRPQYRRQGYASKLLEEMKSQEPNEIWTNYEQISDAGARTFLACGFKSVKSLKKHECDKLVWKLKEQKESD